MLLTLESLATGSPLLSSRDISARCATSYRRAMEIACRSQPSRFEDWIYFRRLEMADQIFFLRLTGVRSAIDSVFIDGDPHQADSDWNRSVSACLKAFHRAKKHASSQLEGWSTAGADLTRILCPDHPFSLSVYQPRHDDESLWSEVRDLEILFRRHMQDSVGAYRCAPVSVTNVEFDRIDRSLEYFSEISTSASDDILYNARLIVKIDYEEANNIGRDGYREIGQSVSTHSVPSAFFLSPYSLSFDEICAESIYHEALHKKLSNTLIAYEVLSREADWRDLPTFLSHWNVDTQWNRNEWEFDRAIYALHVYTHLASLYGDLIKNRDFRFFSEKWCVERYPVCAKRAGWICDWISSVDAMLLQPGRELIAEWGRVIEGVRI